MSDRMSDEEACIEPLPPHYGNVDAHRFHAIARDLQGRLKRKCTRVHFLEAKVERLRGLLYTDDELAALGTQSMTDSDLPEGAVESI